MAAEPSPAWFWGAAILVAGWCVVRGVWCAGCGLGPGDSKPRWFADKRGEMQQAIPPRLAGDRAEASRSMRRWATDRESWMQERPEEARWHAARCHSTTASKSTE